MVYIFSILFYSSRQLIAPYVFYILTIHEIMNIKVTVILNLHNYSSTITFKRCTSINVYLSLPFSKNRI